MPNRSDHSLRPQPAEWSFGPMSYVAGRIWLGDPGARCVALSSRGFSCIEHGAVAQEYTWNECTSLALELPTTHSRPLSRSLDVAEVLAEKATHHIHARDQHPSGKLTIGSGDETYAEWTIDSIISGRYRAKEVAAVCTFLEMLRRHDYFRAIIRDPSRVEHWLTHADTLSNTRK